MEKLTKNGLLISTKNTTNKKKSHEGSFFGQKSVKKLNLNL
jgi:hypothetical protein